MIGRNRVAQGFKRFVDYKKVIIKAGDGGDGAVAFFRSSSSFGPPCGGNGGNGGSVIIRASKEVIDLSALEKRYSARNGVSGSFNQRHGANGSDLILNVPMGTKIKTIDNSVNAINEKCIDSDDDLETVKKYFKFTNSYVPKQDRIKMLLERVPNPHKFNMLELDLINHGDSIRIVNGGKGGLGNPHFVTPQMPGPQISGKGQKGQSRMIEIELKVIADVGLVGMPNAGKS
jgi:GTP-binding protein